MSQKYDVFARYYFKFKPIKKKYIYVNYNPLRNANLELSAVNLLNYSLYTLLCVMIDYKH